MTLEDKSQDKFKKILNNKLTSISLCASEEYKVDTPENKLKQKLITEQFHKCASLLEVHKCLCMCMCRCW